MRGEVRAQEEKEGGGDEGEGALPVAEGRRREWGSGMARGWELR